MTLDRAGLAKIPGIRHYEERWLVLFQLLRRPETRVIFVTSDRLDPIVVEYALDLVSSMPNWHARRRLTLFDCADRESDPLTEKILRRPHLVEEIRQAIGDPLDACLIAFNGTSFERDLAVQLGIPLYAADPELAHVGTKSGSRWVFAEAGIAVADGFEDLWDVRDVARALATLRARNRELKQGMIKLNDGFGASGNVLFSFEGAPAAGLEDWIASELPRRAVFASPPDTWYGYVDKLRAVGGIVEEFLDASETRSPSAQLLISPGGAVRLLSTQDQMLAGAENQIYVGGTFPADPEYRGEIQGLADRVGKTLAAKSVVGPLSIDFLSARSSAGWRHYGLEINLRLGGGTASYFMLNGLVDGKFDHQSGSYVAPDGEPRCFCATHWLQHERYRAFGPDTIVDAALRHGLHYGANYQGTAFYMLGALEIGRLGMVAVGRTSADATRRYKEVVVMLDAESERLPKP